MTERGRLALSVLVVAALAGCGGPREEVPSQHVAWITQLRSTDATEQLAAIEAVTRAKVTRAVPTLRTLLYNVEPRVRAAAADALARLDARQTAGEVEKLLSDDAWEVRAAAAGALSRMQYAAAMPDVVTLMNDPVAAVREAAAEALAGFGEAGQARLVEMSTATNAAKRAAAVTGLGLVDSEGAREAVRTALTDSDPPVRVAAAAALRGKADEAALPALVVLLSDRDRSVRKVAQATLVSYGPQAIPVMADLLESGSREAAVGAVEVLGRIGEPECLPILLKARIGRERAAQQTAEKLIRLQLRTGRGVGAALKVAAGGDPVLARTALWALRDAEVDIPTETLLPLLQRDDEALRLDAIKMLQGKKDERIPPELERLLGAETKSLNLAAAIALAEMGNDRGKDILFAAFTDPKTAAGPLPGIARALGTVKDVRAVEPLLTYAVGPLGARNRNTKQLSSASMEALGAIGDKRAVQPIVDWLAKSLSTWQRFRDGQEETAARALGQLGDPRAFDVLVRGAEIYSHRMHDKVRRVFLNAIVAADPERALPFLTEYMKKTDIVDHARFTDLTKLLAGFDDPRAVAPILTPLVSDIPEIRQRAGRSLMGMVTNNAACAKEAVVQMKQVPANTRSAVAAVLAEAGAPVRDEVVAGLGSDAPEIRQGCAWALGMSADPKAVDLLLKVLEDKNPHVRGAAGWSLAQLRDPRAVEPLLALIDDPDPKVRIGTIDALGQLSDKRAVEPIRSLLSDTNEVIRASAVRALGMLNALEGEDKIETKTK